MVSPVTLSSWVSLAVRKITGTRFPSRRSLRTISNPSTSGSSTSRMSRSKGVARASRSASVPFSATATSKPRKRSEAATAPRRNNISKLDVAAGGTVRNGEQLAELDGQPLFALAGTVPAWRDLTPGETGPDVTELQQALASLGYYDDGDTAGYYGAAT